MIEVNLLPGGGKRAPGGKKKKKASGGAGGGGGGGGFKPSFKLPSFGSLNLPSLDGWLLFAILGWIAGPLLLGGTYLGVKNKTAELQVQIDEAVQDSIKYARLIAAQAELQARYDAIAQKVAIIEEIDDGRYIWPHVLDEVSRALPQYTWLIGLNPIQSENRWLPDFQLVGRTGNTFALTQFMKDLEASPFLQNVRLVFTEQVKDESGLMVHEFQLLVGYEKPPRELIEMVPLFVED